MRHTSTLTVMLTNKVDTFEGKKPNTMHELTMYPGEVDDWCVMCAKEITGPMKPRKIFSRVFIIQKTVTSIYSCEWSRGGQLMGILFHVLCQCQ